MDHRLLQQLNPNFSTHILRTNLTPYPANGGIINPGLGNVLKPYGLFVPLYTHRNVYQKTKDKPNVQEGSGKSEDVEKKGPIWIRCCQFFVSKNF